jgi:hypothetical protein
MPVSRKSNNEKCILRYVAIYDLKHNRVAIFGMKVEGLRLHARCIRRKPLEVGLCNLGEGRIALILAYGLDGFGAVLGFLGAGDVGQSMYM